MITEIKYRFWNTDYTQQPMMEVGDTGDLKFVERSIGKKKMLFTGLQDKNDKEIYEGDIDETFGVIEFKEGAFWLGSSILQYKLDKFQVEVIGNIYENPELLITN